MPYKSLISDITLRFNETNLLLNIIKSNEESVMPPAPEKTEHKIFKALFYVSLYSCIEYTFSELSTKTLLLIKSKSIEYNHFESKFLTIALSSHLQTIRDCNSKKLLDKSADMFHLSNSSEISNFNEIFINQYLHNIWGKSFNQLTKTLGTSTFPLLPREITIFDEIVENRNIVAHGRELAQTVGSSPKYSDLKSKYDIVFDVINRFVLHFESFYNNKEYLKAVNRTLY